MMTSPLHEQEATPDFYRKQARLFYTIVPFYLLVPFLIWLFFHRDGTTFYWSALGLGALGWIVALMLRGPIAFLSRNLPKKTAMLLVGLSSGPLEEGVRLALLLLTGTSISWALSVGQGWAAIEVLYVIVNGFVLVNVIQKNDEKSIEAKKFLEAQGLIQSSPLWGVFERVFASLFHIGATLIIAHSPSMTPIVLVVHSAVNLGAVRLSRKHMLLTQLFMAITGITAVAVGLNAFNN